MLWYFTEKNVKSITNIEIKRSRRDEKEPYEIVYMIIDGMDEMKLMIPKTHQFNEILFKCMEVKNPSDWRSKPWKTADWVFRLAPMAP